MNNPAELSPRKSRQPRRILLTGISGQLGQELRHLLPPETVIGVGRSALDLSRPSAIARLIHEVKPDLILNAAAYTAVDRAESEPELATAINSRAPQIMAQAAQQLGIPLVHLSTDYVFDGRSNTPYREDDLPNPLSAYGQSKWAGEVGIQQSGARYLIVRTAWVYSTYGQGNFVKTMLKLGATRSELRVVADQIGSPTWARDLASALVTLVQAEATGIYHFTHSGVASWYDFACAIFEEAQPLGFPLAVQRVVPITTPEYPTPAKRPAYSVLSPSKTTAVLGHYPPHWRESLRLMLQQYAQIGQVD